MNFEVLECKGRLTWQQPTDSPDGSAEQSVLYNGTSGESLWRLGLIYDGADRRST
jgi:hypothetical protein